MPKKSSKKKHSSNKSFNFINISKHQPDLRKKEPPLVDIEVSNPLTYLKSWWRRVIGNEGIDFRFRIKPLTAIAMTIIVATCGFGLGRFSLSIKKPYIKYIPVVDQNPAPTPIPWRQTAFEGQLRYSQQLDKYYLLIGQSEAVNLDIKQVVEPDQYLGERVFIEGTFHPESKLLEVLVISRGN
ncbi:MAG: hypothetical protein GF381_00880 [Candidatus Pacebacteria bacterium]|nr:hypothetical protein [Candidatus Paceibacterota bacterium]